MHKGPKGPNPNHFNVEEFDISSDAAIAHKMAEEAQAEAQATTNIRFYTTPQHKTTFTEAEKRYANNRFISIVLRKFTDNQPAGSEFDIAFDRDPSGFKRVPQFLILAAKDPATKSVDISYQADKKAPVVTHQEWLDFFSAAAGHNKWNTALTATIQNGPPVRGSDFVIEVVDEGTSLGFKVRQKSKGNAPDAVTDLSPAEAERIGALVPKAMQAYLKAKAPASAPCVYTHPTDDDSLLKDTIEAVKKEARDKSKFIKAFVYTICLFYFNSIHHPRLCKY